MFFLAASIYTYQGSVDIGILFSFYYLDLLFAGRINNFIVLQLPIWDLISQLPDQASAPFELQLSAFITQTSGE